jgi:ligand-binding sensor domain-containing protein
MQWRQLKLEIYRKKEQPRINFENMINIDKPTFLSLLSATMFFISSNAQVKRDLRNENTTFSFGQSKLIKTQMSQQGDNVHCSLQDRKGNLWFATTSNGVYRYDGKFFKNFTVKDGLINNAVSSILQDREGNIWFGTFSGLSRFDGKTFSNILSPNFFVYSMLEDRSGRLWCSTNNGVYWYDGKAFTSFLENQSVINSNGLKLGRVNRMLEDKNGNVWFTTTSEGVCCYDGKSIVN